MDRYLKTIGDRFLLLWSKALFTIDPKFEEFLLQSPYVYAANDLIKYIDENGENPLLGAFIVGGVELFLQVATNVYNTRNDLTTENLLKAANG